MRVQSFVPEHLPHVQQLINVHLSAMVPGWALPEAFIASRMQREPGQYIIDPWVTERVTLCAVEHHRVLAAAHLLRYGFGPEVGADYRGTGDIAWFLAWPEDPEAAIVILRAARDQFAAWGVTREYAWDSGLPVGPCVGIPDAWPHISDALIAAGFQPDRKRDEAAYGGRLTPIPLPSDPPVPGLSVRRIVRARGVSFVALVEGQEVGRCACIPDLTLGGALPALGGWAELTEMGVQEQWRGHGIGTWLLRHAVEWLRLSSCERIVLAIAADDEAAGAGRFYQRFGWDALVREQQGWRHLTPLQS